MMLLDLILFIWMRGINILQVLLPAPVAARHLQAVAAV